MSLTYGLVAFLVAACGISLSAEGGDSEIFKELAIEGEPVAGESLSLILEYEQPYPVAVDIACDVLKGERDEEQADADGEDDLESRRVSRILRTSLPENPTGGPLGEATPVADTIEEAFDAPELPGRYVVLCFTREDEDNAIARLIAVTAPSAPPATP